MDLDAEIIKLRKGLAEAHEAIKALAEAHGAPKPPSQNDQDIPDHGRGLFDLEERITKLETKMDEVTGNVSLFLERILVLEDALEAKAPLYPTEHQKAS